MSNYQPKLNPDAVLAGYTGIEPRRLGTLQGYITKQTQPAPVKVNPYMKHKGQK